jgi:hypothetical protein
MTMANRLWFQLNIVTVDNRSITIQSDTDWTGRQGSITFDSVYGKSQFPHSSHSLFIDGFGNQCHLHFV